jgi:hypothetical protein
LNKQRFINEILPGAKEGYKKYNLLPSLTIAQAILESGWGESTLSIKANNLFGIKAKNQDKKIEFETTEYINGKKIKIMANFKAYETFKDSILDHTIFLSTDRYEKVRKANDYVEGAKALYICGYATDPNYPSKLINIIKKYELYKYDEKGGINMSRKLEDLHPYVRYLAEKFIEECKNQGIEVLIYCTYRSKEEQNKFYAKGRSTAGKIVTNAKGGYSYHNYGLAFDCVPVIDYKAQWDRVDLYEKIGAIGESIGLKWGGHFKGFTDRPHFQWSNNLRIKHLLKGKKPVPPIDSSMVDPVCKLHKHNIINTPNYWIESNTYKIEYFKQIVINYTKQHSFEEGIKYLARNRIIDSPNYWMDNDTYSIENCKLLIKKIANSIK